MAKQTRRRDAKDTRENGFESLCAYGCVGVSACMGACVYTLTPGHCKVQRSGWSLCIHTHTHTTHTCIHIHIYWLGGGVRSPSFFWRRGDLPVLHFIYLCATRYNQAGCKPIPLGLCISSLPRLCPTGTCGPVPGGRLPGTRSSRQSRDRARGVFHWNRPPVFPPRRFTIPPMYHERGLNSSGG